MHGTRQLFATPRLDGRTALVTGAGTGIGRAIALELGLAGARVIAVGRDAGRLAATCEQIAAGDGRAEALAADVCESAWLAELDRLAPEGVDLLVNNAATFASYAPLEQVPVDEQRAVIATGLDAVLALCRHVLPGMKQRGFGRVINLGSMAGGLGAEGQVVYSSVKAALVGLTRSLALECAPHGVTCNLIEPGVIDTERVERAIAPELRAQLVANTPLGRFGRPEEVAWVVAFLASERASFVTGATIPVAGGMGLGVYARGPGQRDADA